MKIEFSRNGCTATIEPSDLEFEAVCPVCQLGRMPGSGVPCSTCDGMGIVLTPLGQHVVALVVRHGRKFSDAVKKANEQRKNQEKKS